MAKQRTLNEIRQEKNYGYRAPFAITNNIDQEATKQMAQIDLDEVKDEIVDKLTKDLHDIFFEHICKEMSNHAAFQSQTYLTEEGYELFEDEWFEFYHNHHGDIMYEVMQNITN